MSLLNSTGDRLRRATQLWHAFLATTGQRFELAQFVQDPAFEQQILVKSLASGDAKLAALAQEWLRDTGQPVPAVATSRRVAGAVESAAPQEEPTKPGRYLRGVR